ncbi:hypothetical protein BKP35_08645 [Anaerobacillus arseniciselenatis]|uniref:Uncharacterized protein n=1 Tax=Anaerobacillus arseniciselenatis TaxID=85682 RepID=A0A1S2LNC5_9BACI|nr:hypothetical protein [Anaerobacillus arseniciselenatis]OIJ13834.1 hypothetical protein BKP35_08645 [Anaerobacillus arseniciselenatis]
MNLKSLKILLVLLLLFTTFSPTLASNDKGTKINGKYEVIKEIISDAITAKKGNEEFLGIKGKPKNIFLIPNLDIKDKMVDGIIYGEVTGNVVVKLENRAINLNVNGDLEKFEVNNSETYFGPLHATLKHKGEEYPAYLGFFYDLTNDDVTSSLTIGYIDASVGNAHIMFGDISTNYKATMDLIFERREKEQSSYESDFDDQTKVNDEKEEQVFSIMSTAEYNYKAGGHVHTLNNTTVGSGTNNTWVLYGFVYAQDGNLGGGRTGNGYVHLNSYTNSKNVERYVTSLGGRDVDAYVDKIFIDYEARNSTLNNVNLWTNDTWRLDWWNPQASQKISSMSMSVKNLQGTLVTLLINGFIAAHNSSLPVSVATTTYGGKTKKVSHTFNMRLSNDSDFSTTSWSAEPTYTSNNGRGVGTKYEYRSDLGGARGTTVARFRANWLVSSSTNYYQGYYGSTTLERAIVLDL